MPLKKHIATPPVPGKMLNRKYLRMREQNKYHLVTNSILPITTGFSAMLLVMNLVFYWHPSSISAINFIDSVSLQIGTFLFLGILFSWFLTVVVESNAHHTVEVRRGLRYGMILFIVSEVMFFFAFFWGFFHVSLSPSAAIGCVWPPQGIQPMETWGLPFVNTLLLLSSGATLTYAHHVFFTNRANTTAFIWRLAATILLGLIFLVCQAIEYKYGVTFSWKDNIYGTIFYVTTGFHGAHVIIGVLFLIFCLLREVVDVVLTHFSKHTGTEFNFDLNLSATQHIGFEAAAWYWHFVDVVWLVLFTAIYWWGSAL